MPKFNQENQSPNPSLTPVRPKVTRKREGDLDHLDKRIKGNDDMELMPPPAPRKPKRSASQADLENLSAKTKSARRVLGEHLQSADGNQKTSSTQSQSFNSWRSEPAKFQRPVRFGALPSTGAIKPLVRAAQVVQATACREFFSPKPVNRRSSQSEPEPKRAFFMKTPDNAHGRAAVNALYEIEYLFSGMEI